MHAVFNESNLMRTRHEKQAFREATPFPHVVIDGLVHEDVIAQVIAEFPGPADIAWKAHVHAASRKLSCNNPRLLGPTTQLVLNELNGPNFLDYLIDVTGIEALQADPALEGGGLHQIERGGFLGIHADFNIHPASRLDRRLNVLLYLNPVWRNEWGGHLELWTRDMARCADRIAPLANRMVVFATTDTSFHGHPTPLACPPGVTRRSIATYYYSAGRPESERSAEHSTLYQRLPTDSPRGRLP